jgi:hypothetical protein
VQSEEQAKKVPKIFPTNEIARNKIDMVRILSEMEKCTSNINFDG